MGRISKLGSCITLILLLIITVGLFGCGSSSSSAPPPPTITVTLNPNPTASMNLGSTLQFSATVTQNKTLINTPISFFSSRNKTLSFSPSGLACAGTWDTSFIVCSPGAPGVVRVFASGFGTPSASTTVYVHPQVTNIQVSPASAICIPQNQSADFRATVLSQSADITAFVGPVTWAVADPTVAKASTTVTGLQPNQVQVTAAQPGLTQIIPSNSGLNGQPAQFETCPVQSISVVASNTGTGSLQLQSGSGGSLTPGVIDSLGNLISVTGLTWISSQPGVATTKAGSVTAVSPGGAAIFPVCNPPSCNVNLYPVYSGNVVLAKVSGTIPASTVFVTSTGCFGAAVNCKTSLIPINTQKNTAGAAIPLPSAPNSFLIDPSGASGYMESAGGLRTLAIASGTVQTTASVVGKVLAVSPDNTQVVVSDTTDSPNVVYIVGTKTNSVTPLLLSGVTAAAFSPVSTAVYLLAGNTLYVYSTTHPLQTVSLPGAASDAAFLTTGTFGFVATDASSISLFNGCNNAAPLSPNTSSVSTISQPSLMAALPDGKTIAAVNSPGFSAVAVNTSAAGCPPPVTATATFHDFGLGNFTPKQILVSSDGSRLYVISNLNAVMVYDFALGAVRTIALNPPATPLSAALTLSGHDLYVGASDGTVHHLDTNNTFSDVGQIAVSLCSNSSISCPPDLVVLRP